MINGNFSWIPFFTEMARILNDYEHRQEVLIDFLYQAGVASGLEDELSSGEKSPLQEIDPFTFINCILKYGNKKRTSILANLKTLLNIEAELPDDYDGIPSVDPRNAWMFPYGYERDEKQIPYLWKFFGELVYGEIIHSLFNELLAMPFIGVSKLTSAMFCIAPETHLPIYKQTIAYFQLPRVVDFDTYVRALHLVRDLEPDLTFYEISYQAWQQSQGIKTDSSVSNDELNSAIDADDLKKDTPDGLVAEADKTEMHTDAPSRVDMLNRRPYARYLAQRFTKFWQKINQQKHQSDKSYVIHLHSEWGSGKSTFLSFLQDELKSNSAAENKPWQLVEYNAWQNQHIKPAWWPFMQSVIDSSLKKDSWKKRTKESWRRLKSGFSADTWIKVTIFGMVAAVAFAFDEGSSVLTKITATLGGVGVISVFVSGLYKSLLTSSESSAKNYIRFTKDPLGNVKDHFCKFLDSLDKPLFILIDDLDRCREENVVELLESLHILFNDKRVFYLIAADKKWISTCFHNSYKNIAEHIEDKERPTGSLFVEKLFQMSIGLPAISPNIRLKYLNSLLNVDEQKEKLTNKEKEQAKQKIKVTTKAIQQANNYTEISEIDIDEPEVFEALIEKTQDEEFEQDLEHRLASYKDYLEANPRFIKLLVNTYSINVFLARISGHAVNAQDFEQVAIWTIISLRYPAVADEISNDVQLIDQYITAVDDLEDSKDYNLEGYKLAPAISVMLSSRVLYDLLSGKVKQSGPLNKKVVLVLSGKAEELSSE